MNQDRNHVVLFIFVMTLINNAASAAFEAKRAWPEVRGTLATKRSAPEWPEVRGTLSAKRSAPDIFGMLEDNGIDNKSTFEDIKNTVLKRLQREIRDEHSNYIESNTDFSLEGDGKSDSIGPYPVGSPIEYPSKTVEFQTNGWPRDYHRQQPYQRQIGELVNWIRNNCKMAKDVSVVKRKKFDLDWDVTRGKRALPDNRIDFVLTSSKYGCFLQVTEM